MKKFWWILVGIMSTSALACSPGSGGPAGDPNCMGGVLRSDPNYYGGGSGSYGSDSSTGSSIVIHIPPKFGALALDPIASSTGSSYDADTKEQAIEWALESCRAGGKNKHCKSVMWVQNGCIAAASGRDKKLGGGKLFPAIGLPGEAEPNAMKKCQKSPAVTDCYISFKELCSLS